MDPSSKGFWIFSTRKEGLLQTLSEVYYQLDWNFWLGKFYLLLRQFLLKVGLNFISGFNSFIYGCVEFNSGCCSFNYGRVDLIPVATNLLSG